ncbi:MAG: alginate export family protein [Phaeospirillum sp.]|nr:alginate export family protein [Phaeospirillum sp.]
MVGLDLRCRSLVTGAILSVVVGVAAMPASADVSLYDSDGLKVDGAFTGGITGFTSPGTQFGAGSWTNNSGAPGKRISGKASWTEWFLTPELKASLETERFGTFYGDVSGQVSATGGDGDASLISTTYGHPVLFGLENLYAGWKSAKLIDGLDENAIDLSGGRQSFRVADGFLISNGVNNQGQRGMFWTQSRTAFAQTGILKAATGPVRGDVFYLQNQSNNSLMPAGLIDNAKTKVVGGNIEWFESVASEDGKPARDGASTFADRKWYAGLTYFNVVEANSGGNLSFNSTANNGAVTNTLTSNREGMNVISAHVGGNMLPFLPDFSLYGNYVYENNNTAKHKVNANAWYLEPGYQLSDVAWTPKLSYRYAHFSGDNNPNDSTKKAYDPFFYNAITRGFGTWFIGEIVGNYVISNSNVNIHQVAFSVNPIDTVKLSVLAYTYNYAAKAQNAGVTSDNLAREIDFTAEWAINEHVSLSGAFAAAAAGTGYRQNVSANSGPAGLPMDKTWLLAETSLVVKF